MVSALSLEIVQSARIDGAGEFRIFNQIALPIMKPAIATQAIFSFVSSWNDLFKPLVLLTKEAVDLHPLSVFLSKINTGDAGVAFSVAAIYMIIPLLIFLYCEDYLVEGVSYSGGLKG
jgi:multiple sugar transport system permease protein